MIFAGRGRYGSHPVELLQVIPGELRLHTAGPILSNTYPFDVGLVMMTCPIYPNATSIHIRAWNLKPYHTYTWDLTGDNNHIYANGVFTTSMLEYVEVGGFICDSQSMFLTDNTIGNAIVVLRIYDDGNEILPFTSKYVITPIPHDPSIPHIDCITDVTWC